MNTSTDSSTTTTNGQYTIATADPLRIRDLFKTWEIALWAGWQGLNLFGICYAIFYLIRGVA